MREPKASRAGALKALIERACGTLPVSIALEAGQSMVCR
jgi:hypothetical protein